MEKLVSEKSNHTDDYLSFTLFFIVYICGITIMYVFKYNFLMWNYVLF